MLLCAVALAGCVSIEQAAPPVIMLGQQASSTSKRAMLEQGRLIYITRCAKCHSVEPVSRYSRLRWDTILPKMADKTKLSAADEEAVHLYVLTVLDQQASMKLRSHAE